MESDARSLPPITSIPEARQRLSELTDSCKDAGDMDTWRKYATALGGSSDLEILELCKEAGIPMDDTMSRFMATERTRPRFRFPYALLSILFLIFLPHTLRDPEAGLTRFVVLGAAILLWKFIAYKKFATEIEEIYQKDEGATDEHQDKASEATLHCADCWQPINDASEECSFCGHQNTPDNKKVSTHVPPKSALQSQPSRYAREDASSAVNTVNQAKALWQQSTQRAKIVMIALVVMLIMTLLPPWVTTSSRTRSSLRRAPVTTTSTHFHYAPIWSPPRGRDSAHVDLGRLALQYIAVALVTGGIIFVLHEAEKGKKEEEE